MKIATALRIAYANKMLLEYDNSKSGVTLAAPGGEKASGKNYDNIAIGKSQPYKDNEYETKYDKVYPQLGLLVKRLKNSAIKGDIVITGQALNELGQLLKTFNPKMSDNNEVILPFGDNIRLKVRGDRFFLGFAQEWLDENK